ncbi:hypothetical protein [Kluyvera ascorbata]|uniref:hypothetical protein n=1 Tax=Kluyvera ascorbata TaxID=51288 RepID=UPI000F4B99C2|nr:hypothetical protein [Kluyvera ascorbata]
MTKAETENYLFNIYRAWVQENATTSEKGLMFWGYINSLPDFTQFRFGRDIPYQRTAIWVSDWNSRLGINN